MAECLLVAMPRRAGKRDEIDKAKPKAKVKKEAKKQSQGQQRKKKPKGKAKNQEEAIKKARKEGLKNNNPTARHTTNPPVPCLGRSFLIPNVRKARA